MKKELGQRTRAAGKSSEKCGMGGDAGGFKLWGRTDKSCGLQPWWGFR